MRRLIFLKLLEQAVCNDLLVRSHIVMRTSSLVTVTTLAKMRLVTCITIQPSRDCHFVMHCKISLNNFAVICNYSQNVIHRFHGVVNATHHTRHMATVRKIGVLFWLHYVPVFIIFRSRCYQKFFYDLPLLIVWLIL